MDIFLERRIHMKYKEPNSKFLKFLLKKQTHERGKHNESSLFVCRALLFSLQIAIFSFFLPSDYDKSPFGKHFFWISFPKWNKDGVPFHQIMEKKNLNYSKWSFVIHPVFRVWFFKRVPVWSQPLIQSTLFDKYHTKIAPIVEISPRIRVFRMTNCFLCAFLCR